LGAEKVFGLGGGFIVRGPRNRKVNFLSRFQPCAIVKAVDQIEQQKQKEEGKRERDEKKKRATEKRVGKLRKQGLSSMYRSQKRRNFVRITILLSRRKTSRLQTGEGTKKR